jgi:hypothetical protein
MRDGMREEKIDSIQKLNMFLSQKNIAFFGAGYAAEQISNYSVNHGFDVDRIVVSSVDGNPRAIRGIPVVLLDKLSEQSNDGFNVLVCLTEKNQSEIPALLYRFEVIKSVFYVTDALISEVRVRNSDIADRNIEQFDELKQQMEFHYENLRYQMLRYAVKPCLEYMIVNILDHCNLRCKGCDHFACIADEKIFSQEGLYRDLERLSQIFNGDYIIKIAVMGGEPLLHPELKQILADVRYFFPHTEIRLTTNGLLLLQQDEDFWKVCRENEVTIVNTKYPINLDHEEMKKKAQSENVKFKFFEGTGDGVIKQSFKKHINLAGDSDPADSFSKCHISNYGNILLDGKFYGCPFSVQSYRIFNKKFNQNLRMTEEDYIDIYQDVTKEDFFRFAAKPKFYCRYCKGLSEPFDWERSKQQMCEWV